MKILNKMIIPKIKRYGLIKGIHEHTRDKMSIAICIEDCDRFYQYANNYEPWRELDRDELKLLIKEWFDYRKFKKTLQYKILLWLLQFDKVKEWHI
jgi:hypothetical protein